MNEQNKKYVNYKSKKTNRRDPHRRTGRITSTTTPIYK